MGFVAARAVFWWFPRGFLNTGLCDVVLNFWFLHGLEKNSTIPAKRLRMSTCSSGFQRVPWVKLQYRWHTRWIWLTSNHS